MNLQQTQQAQLAGQQANLAQAEALRKNHLIVENGEEQGVVEGTAKHLVGRGLIYNQQDAESPNLYHIVDGHTWADVEAAIAAYEWTAEDAKAAASQGWDLFEIDPVGKNRQIQRDADSTRFASDLDAIEFVQQQANAGNPVAAKALKLDWTFAATAVDRKPQPRLFEGQWPHPFGPGSSETLCRIVVDAENNELVAAQAKDGLKWIWLSRASLLDLADSLFHANEVSEKPEEHGLSSIDALPDWAVVPQA